MIMSKKYYTVYIFGAINSKRIGVSYEKLVCPYVIRYFIVPMNTSHREIGHKLSVIDTTETSLS